MTDGILLRELEHDRQLRRYDTLIIDEAHERSLNIDFLLGVLKRLLPQRPELRVIDHVRDHRSAALRRVLRRRADHRSVRPQLSGRSALSAAESATTRTTELSLTEGIVAAVHELDRADRGDMLVFLPGEKQIREAAEALGKARLHRDRSAAAVLRGCRRASRSGSSRSTAHAAIVLATNVAETSLTVPGIRYVVDSGLARISRYSVRGKVQRLPIEPISQASADQRKGRCGRESAGHLHPPVRGRRLRSCAPAFTPPEVLRTNLASVILQMAALGLGEPQDFPFVDPPDTRLINDGYGCCRS